MPKKRSSKVKQGFGPTCWRWRQGLARGAGLWRPYKSAVSGPAITFCQAAVWLLPVGWQHIRCCFSWPLLLSLPPLILLPYLLSTLVARNCG